MARKRFDWKFAQDLAPGDHIRLTDGVYRVMSKPSKSTTFSFLVSIQLANSDGHPDRLDVMAKSRFDLVREEAGNA